MADNTTCPNCGRAVKIPDSSIGQTVECPHCNQDFVAGASSVTSQPIPVPSSKSRSDDVEDDRPRRRRYDEEDDDDLDVDVRRPSGPMPHNYLVESILVLLFCCQIFGIIALVNAVQVSNHYSRGEYEKAVEASEAAKKWCIWGALLGPIATIILIALQIAALGVG